MKIAIAILLILGFSLQSHAQGGVISGTVSGEGAPLPYAHVQLGEGEWSTRTDTGGRFTLENIPHGKYQLKASFTGYETIRKNISLTENDPAVELQIELPPTSLLLGEIVVTGTKTFKRQANSPVIVSVIDDEMLQNVQACNPAEGLRFQPGLRVEVDCQTCNYTQLRMNGLGGSYSRILINGRPTLSPLTGLYGLEQIPANMIDRIEVVRGGASALYGSSAIGGTVNIITSIPKENNYELGYTHQSTGGIPDHIISGNATAAAENGRSGLSVFVQKRRRNMYDHNGDRFSELPALRNNSFGANLYLKPAENQKITLGVASLDEYRYGGEMIDGAPHLALQSEERDHKVLLGNLDYQINFNDDNSSLIAFAAAQQTDRTHFTGIFPGSESAIEDYLADPPYGTSLTTTFQGGLQYNHRFGNFPLGENVFTAGVEYQRDRVFDEIETYRYEIDQLSKNIGAYVQSDWKITPSLDLLGGLRADRSNLVGGFIYSPRFSLMYSTSSNAQFRLNWSTGFRAPQAFDTDLHIAFAGGGISRVALAPDLKEERSGSFSASVNYDKATEDYVAGFTLEGFYTRLEDAFYLHPLGEDEFGQRFEKRNGSSAIVKGVVLELRANYIQKMQLEAGITWQTSRYEDPVQQIEGFEAIADFLRTPDTYGYASLSWSPNKRFSAGFNLIYTGSMLLTHYAGAPEQKKDEIIQTPGFLEPGLRTEYKIPLPDLKTKLAVYAGIKNLSDSYQNDFDSGKNRDSNYVYGPAAPRTFFVGVKISN